MKALPSVFIRFHKSLFSSWGQVLNLSVKPSISKKFLIISKTYIWSSSNLESPSISACSNLLRKLRLLIMNDKNSKYLSSEIASSVLIFCTLKMTGPKILLATNEVKVTPPTHLASFLTTPLIP